ncbi:unnamed protein product [Ilex paraguariensis]|uniref:Uncharacterized protein n=1 Tax=Ilex paraguariensis TaxID=185542 RepID=A0ABC8THR5_9AQUA
MCLGALLLLLFCFIDFSTNQLRQLEDIRGSHRSPKSSSYASTPSSGTLTSDGGHVSSVDFSPKSLEKHCRPIDDVIMEIELKGTLIQRLVHVEDRVVKLCLQLEGEFEAEKRREEQSAEKKPKKKGLKQRINSWVKGSKRHKGRTKQ